MKKLIALSLLVLATATGSAQGILLTPGSDFYFEFNFLTLIGPSPISDRVIISATFSGDPVSAGETIFTACTKTFLPTGPFIRLFFNPPVPYSATSGMCGPHWTDNQGLIRLNMIFGQAVLTGLEVFVQRDNLLYRAIIPVPEPSVFLLGALALPAGLWVLRRRVRAARNSA